VIDASERFQLLTEIQQEFEREAESLPGSLRSMVLRSYAPDDADSPGLLSLAALPFWLGEALGVEKDACRDLAVGNLYLLHLFQSFDSIVDEDRPEIHTRSQAVLGNLCYHKVLRRYLLHLSPSPAFWERMAAYWQEWAECMMWEVEITSLGYPAYARGLESEYIRIAAHKAAALKICPTAMALMVRRPELIPLLEDCVDGMHSVMQLVDDLFDWREDYLHGRYNALLGLGVSQNLLDPAYEADGQAIERLSSILVEGSLAQDYLRIVDDFAIHATTTIAAAQSRLAEGGPALGPWIRLVDGLVEQIRHRIGLFQQVANGLKLPAL
jgi:hypothetical protein